MTATIVDGRAIAAEILAELKREIQEKGLTPRLDIFIVGKDSAIESFVARKRNSAKEIGVTFTEHRFPEETTQEELITAVKVVIEKTDGIVIQLPLPAHIDTKAALNTIPENLDVDVLTESGYEGFVTQKHDLEPPVGGAMREILERHNVQIAGKKVLVIGKGQLVGQPVIEYFKRQDLQNLFVADKSTTREDFLGYAASADIIVSGTGVAGLIKPEMIKDGVVLLDAGTSGSSKRVLGDITYECEDKASLFSKTPGGIGPITVAVLYKNLLRAL